MQKSIAEVRIKGEIGEALVFRCYVPLPKV